MLFRRGVVDDRDNQRSALRKRIEIQRHQMQNLHLIWELNRRLRDQSLKRRRDGSATGVRCRHLCAPALGSHLAAACTLSGSKDCGWQCAGHERRYPDKEHENQHARFGQTLHVITLSHSVRQAAQSKNLPNFNPGNSRDTVIGTIDDSRAQASNQPLRICMSQKQRCKLTTVRLKATFSQLLLLLLVSVPMFASICAIRCETMTSTGSRNQMVGMTHYHMPSQLDSGSQGASALTSSQPCTGHVCRNDWTFLQTSVVHEFGFTSLGIALANHAVPSLPIAAYLQFQANRSTHSIPPFDPIVSSLRI